MMTLCCICDDEIIASDDARVEGNLAAHEECYDDRLTLYRLGKMYARDHGIPWPITEKSARVVLEKYDGLPR